MPLQVGSKLGYVGLSRLGVAQVVQVDYLVSYTDRPVDGVEKGDHLHVNHRLRGTENLHPYLGVLPVAAPLLALLAKHRTDVEQLNRLRELVQVVLDVGPDVPRRALGPESHLPIALVLEGEHLLLHNDVRALPRRPREESRVLEDRRADLRIVVTYEELARPILHEGPEFRPFVRLPTSRENVVGAPRPAKFRHDGPGGRYGFVRSSSTAVRTGPWPAYRRVSSSQSGITLRMDSSMSSHEAPGISVRPTLPGRIRSPTIWSSPTTNVTDPGECPGVWNTLMPRPARSSARPSSSGW